MKWRNYRGSQQVKIDQGWIDAFADLTGERQFIHVDPEAARASSFGGTIAHGFLTLALVSRFADEAAFRLEGSELLINYGLNRGRFLAPVLSEQRIRGRFVFRHAIPKGARQIVLVYDVTVEIEDGDRPALVCEWMVLHELATSESGGDDISSGI
ncbi:MULTISPECIES: MaoC family dehydratase [Hyphomonas]|uniref:Nodulation protein NodN n=1 Tax=Hyphomonas adhaerens TaxID=81029 RepID=A0A3B9GUW2_9PROT|nr:MaoC family dehydratase [Hyphomonas adhaerens]MBB41584.1 nodulation protein NodN [Hyphomonas sp.]HAE25804.1 nodulation protein NodN [Hyphomonas adhaerens]